MSKTVEAEPYLKPGKVGEGIKVFDAGSFLRFESSGSEEGRWRFLSVSWESEMSLGTFLKQASLIFDKYPNESSVDKDGTNVSAENMDGSLFSEEGISCSDAIVKIQELEEGKQRIGFLRIGNSKITFTWSPGEVGFNCAPNNFPDKPSFRESFLGFYGASMPSWEIKIFDSMLKKTLRENFGVPSKDLQSK